MNSDTLQHISYTYMHFVLQFLLDFQFYLEQSLRSSKVVKNGVNNKCFCLLYIYKDVFVYSDTK